MSDSAPSPQEEQGAQSVWSEPPWCGWIETTGDALLILEAARRGLIPRVTRRLVDSERKMITSGSVFVFDEDESGIKRWTDGFMWSASRILGNFLLYREINKRSNARGSKNAVASAESPPAEEGAEGAEASNDASDNLIGKPNNLQALSQGIDKNRERLLLGSLTNNPKYKVDGMVKKTFSLTIGGVSQHLISYYKVADVESGRLRAPSSLPELATLEISPEYLEKTHFRQAPRVEVGPDGVPRYRGEAEDPDGAVRGSSSSKGGRRYDPYSASTAKKARKTKPPARQPSTAHPQSSSHYDQYAHYYSMGYPYGYSMDPAAAASAYSAYASYYYGTGYSGQYPHAATSSASDQRPAAGDDAGESDEDDEEQPDDNASVEKDDG